MAAQLFINNRILCLLIGCCCLFSCKKETADDESPVVTQLLLNGNPDSTGVNAGDTLGIAFQVTDNQSLNQYRITIYNAFNGFTYRNTAFSYTYVGQLEGTSQSVSALIPITDTSSSGFYEIKLVAIDHRGNESDPVYGRLLIAQDSVPILTITSPSTTSTNNYSPSDTMVINGSISDISDLKEIKITLKSKSGSGTFYTHTFSLSGTTDTIWDFTEIINQNVPVVLPATSGDYELIIDATDSDGNHNEVFVPVRIL